MLEAEVLFTKDWVPGHIAFHYPQDIDVASMELKRSFRCLYIYYYIIEEEGCQRRKWVGRHGDAFADIFCGTYWDTQTNIA